MNYYFFDCAYGAFDVSSMTVAFGVEDWRIQKVKATAAKAHTAKSLRQKRAFSCGRSWGQQALILVPKW